VLQPDEPDQSDRDCHSPETVDCRRCSEQHCDLWSQLWGSLTVHHELLAYNTRRSKYTRSRQIKLIHSYTVPPCNESSQVHHWIGLSSVLRPHQHSIGYMGDGFYRSKDPTNSIKVLNEKVVKEKTPPKNKENTNYTCIAHTKCRQIQHTSITQQVHQSTVIWDD